MEIAKYQTENKCFCSMLPVFFASKTPEYRFFMAIIWQTNPKHKELP